MEINDALVAIPINPSHFPAKLWCLVNNPKNISIQWDTNGEGVIINQQLFEAELLSPGMTTPGASSSIFKTTNFTSFVRQLNLYGFRKVTPDTSSSDNLSSVNPAPAGFQYHFHNPNFKQGHPELLVNLKRLTCINKAKIEAGLKVSGRTPKRSQHFLRNSEEHSTVGKKGSVLVGQTHQEQANSAPCQHCSSSSRQLMEYDRTPRPSRAWIKDHGNATSPTTLYTDKGVPLSIARRFSIDLACSPNNIHVEQGSQGHKLAFIHHHPQYRSGLYPPVYQCCTPGSLDSDMACSQQSAGSLPHYGYYPNYAVGYHHPSSQNANWQTGGSSDSKNKDVNLDTVFKIVDELQCSPQACMTRVTTPEKNATTSTSDSTSVSISKPASSFD